MAAYAAQLQDCDALGFSVYGENVYYKPIMWDTIYLVMEDGVTPAYVFDFGKHSKPAEIYTAEDVETFNSLIRKIPGMPSFITVSKRPHHLLYQSIVLPD
jgi:hypothetical protein